MVLLVCCCCVADLIPRKFHPVVFGSLMLTFLAAGTWSTCSNQFTLSKYEIGPNLTPGNAEMSTHRFSYKSRQGGCFSPRYLSTYGFDTAGTWTVFTNGTVRVDYETYNLTVYKSSALNLFTAFCGASRNATAGVPESVLDCLPCTTTYRNVVADGYEWIESAQACEPSTEDVTGGDVFRRELDDPYGKTILPKRMMPLISSLRSLVY